MDRSFDPRVGTKNMNNSKPRVIILLDLDCFYAQCEIVRLGVDPATPVALLQWNSALAVSYPARALGIKRGDSFEKIQEKSDGRCIAFHLPVISLDSRTDSSTKSVVETNATETTNKTIRENDNDNVKECYERTYKISPSEQTRLFQEEKNKMRNASEGKASLERYRLASARIFEVILQHLIENLGEKNFILERASIDELFLDVTSICLNQNAPTSLKQLNPLKSKVNKSIEENNHDNVLLDDRQKKDWREETKFLGAPSFPYSGTDFGSLESNDNISSTSNGKPKCTNPLEIGCMIAFQIRKCLQQSLGFTMSAGISTNKLLAKLAAAHGKPDGMAVLYPDGVKNLMDDTNIRKVRNLGGKIGKQVISLLPSDIPPTMGSIRRLLSLHDLTKSLSCPKTARAVFDACRGEDIEPVRETKLNECCLTKSITAFKSFRPIYSLSALDSWLQLLASDIIRRVEIDTKRNNRKPKNCNIQYTFSVQGDFSKRTTRSIRIPFPVNANKLSNDQSYSDPNNSMTQAFSHEVKNALQSKNQFPIHRIGLSATDFISIGQNGSTIDSFFMQYTQNSKSISVVNIEDKIHTESGIFAVNNQKSQSENNSPDHVKEDSFCKKESIGLSQTSSKYLYVPQDRSTLKSYLELKNTSKNKKTAQILPIQRADEHKKGQVENSFQQSTEINDSDDDLLYAQKLQRLYDKESSTGSIRCNTDKNDDNLVKKKACFQNFNKKSSSSPASSESHTRDFILAKKLQASFDRENTIICSYEKKGTIAKKRKIDNFFLKKI